MFQAIRGKGTISPSFPSIAHWGGLKPSLRLVQKPRTDMVSSLEEETVCAFAATTLRNRKKVWKKDFINSCYISSGVSQRNWTIRKRRPKSELVFLVREAVGV